MSKLTIIVLTLLSFSGFTFAQEPNLSSSLRTLLEQQNYTPIKLKKLPTGHITIQATVNSSPATLILDTGASATG